MSRDLDLLKHLSERECNFLCFHDLKEESIGNQEILDFFKLNFEDKKMLLRRRFNWPLKRGLQRNTVIEGDYREKKQLCLNHLIPEKDLRWLDQLPLSYLLHLLTENLYKDNHDFRYFLLSELLDKETCLNLIKTSVDLRGQNRHHSHTLNQRLYKNSQEITESTKPITKFIEKNSSKKQNIEKWLHEYQLKNFNPGYGLDEFNRNSIVSPEHKVIYNALRSNNIELFMIKASSAWSQKKFRDSLNGKRSQSYSLTEDAIEKLEALSKEERRKKNEMLEILIERAWLER